MILGQGEAQATQRFLFPQNLVSSQKQAGNPRHLLLRALGKVSIFGEAAAYSLCESLHENIKNFALGFIII